MSFHNDIGKGHNARREHFSWMILFLSFFAFFFLFFNALYPVIGHDYHYFIPHLLAGKWHALRQGFLPPWYTPHFCGGIPLYGNPQDMFYSIPQILVLIMDPWIAINISVFFMLSFGIWGWYRCGRDLIRLPPSWAYLCALIVISQGFLLVHMIAGHLTFQTAPLIGFILWMIAGKNPGNLLTLGLILACPLSHIFLMKNDGHGRDKHDHKDRS